MGVPFRTGANRGLAAASFALFVYVAQHLVVGPESAQAQAPSRTIDVSIQGGKVAAGERTIRVKEDERVELRFTADSAAELHLHGYDMELRVTPGRPASMTFDAAVTGRFPVAIHGGGGHGNIVYVEVHPR